MGKETEYLLYKIWLLVIKSVKNSGLMANASINSDNLQIFIFYFYKMSTIGVIVSCWLYTSINRHHFPPKPYSSFPFLRYFYPWLLQLVFILIRVITELHLFKVFLPISSWLSIQPIFSWIIIYRLYTFSSTACIMLTKILAYFLHCRLEVVLYPIRWLSRKLQIFYCIFWQPTLRQHLGNVIVTKVIHSWDSCDEVFLSSVLHFNYNIFVL